VSQSATQKPYDLIIVGAGIIGLSIAWQLARRSRLRIAVVEKGAAVAVGSAGASSAVCRHRYTAPEMLQLAIDGIGAYRHWAEFTGLESPRASYHEDGVLWLPGTDLGWAEKEHRRLQAAGVKTELLNDAELHHRFPGFSDCVLVPDVTTGESHECRSGGSHLLESQGGYFDPVNAAEDLLQACRGAGVDVFLSSRVQEIATQGGRISGVLLDSGTRLATPLLINATGPWCRELFEMVNLEVPWELVPTRIQVLYLDRPAELVGHIPVCVDMQGGLYFRSQNRGQQLVVGSILEEDEREAVPDPDHFNRDPDDEFLQRALHLLHHRLPALPYRGKVRGYCGLYTVNREDVHPILGPTAVEGFWVANGFSGHGFKLAPAIGSLFARQLTGVSCDFDSSVALDYFGIDRAPINVDSKSVLA